MATMVMIDVVAAAEPKRHRRSHAKVKTGCLTCKIRRKKCDETRPACLRCTTTGRKCDGYETAPPPPRVTPSRASLPTPPRSGTVTPATSSSPFPAILPAVSPSLLGSTSNNTPSLKPSARSLVPRIVEISSDDRDENTLDTVQEDPLEIVRNPSTAIFHTESENSSFQFFRERTGPEFSGYFDSAFWSGFLLQTCYHQPAIQHAVIALGAAHRRFDLGITPEAFSYCDLAARSYANAISQLSRTICAGDPFAFQITLITSVLLCAFETFQGNDKQAYKHMVGGLRILLDRPWRRISSSKSRSTAQLSQESLYDLFDRLEVLGLEFFGTSAHILTSPHGGVDEELPEVPKSFTTLDQARDVLFTQVHWIFHTVEQNCTDQASLLSKQQDHVLRLLQWSCGYAEFDKTFSKNISVRNVRAIGLLRVYREAAFLLLLLQSPHFTSIDHILSDDNPGPESELDCHTREDRDDALGTHFAKIVAFADALSALPVAGQSHPTFTVDSGVSPPLYLAATKCRSTKLRHQASSLLSKMAGRDKVMDSFGAYLVAEKISAMEEGALADCGAVPRGINVRSIDMHVFLEERRLLMRYCTNDEVDGSLVWTMDWIAF